MSETSKTAAADTKAVKAPAGGAGKPDAQDATGTAPKAAALPEKPAADVKVVPAAESRFATSAEFTSPLTSYVPLAGTPPEHLVRAEYWANVKALKPRCRIWVEEEAGGYVGELYVLRVGQGYASVCWLPGYPMTLPGATGEAKVPAGYRVEWRGHIVKYRVVRTADARELKQGLETMADAEIWLRDYLRMLAA